MNFLITILRNPNNVPILSNLNSPSYFHCNLRNHYMKNCTLKKMKILVVSALVIFGFGLMLNACHPHQMKASHVPIQPSTLRRIYQEDKTSELHTKVVSVPEWMYRMTSSEKDEVLRMTLNICSHSHIKLDHNSTHSLQVEVLEVTRPLCDLLPESVKKQLQQNAKLFKEEH